MKKALIVLALVLTVTGIALAIPEDINNDGKVDMKDIALAAHDFGKVGEGLIGDINHDGKVDMKDIAGIARMFGWPN